MIQRQIFRKIIFGGLLTGATGLYAANCEAPSSPSCCKASELPIYLGKDDLRVDPPEKDLKDKKKAPEIQKPNVIECTFSTIRQQIWSTYDQFSVVMVHVEDFSEKAQDYVQSMYKYLSEESGDATKIGVITLGTLTGYLLACRSRLSRRLLYASIGMYGTAAICYPEETANATRTALAESRKLATITYNFIFGVQKDDIPLPEFPKIPKTMNEVWEMANELGKSASSLITGSDSIPEDKVKSKSDN